MAAYYTSSSPAYYASPATPVLSDSGSTSYGTASGPSTPQGSQYAPLPSKGAAPSYRPATERSHAANTSPHRQNGVLAFGSGAQYERSRSRGDSIGSNGARAPSPQPAGAPFAAPGFPPKEFQDARRNGYNAEWGPPGYPCVAVEQLLPLAGANPLETYPPSMLCAAALVAFRGRPATFDAICARLRAHFPTLAAHASVERSGRPWADQIREALHAYRCFVPCDRAGAAWTVDWTQGTAARVPGTTPDNGLTLFKFEHDFRASKNERDIHKSR